MYRCFKLTMDQCSFTHNLEQFVDDCRKDGCELKKNLTNNFEAILNKAIDENGVISGEEFIKSWFPIDNYDVFLSYSHDDEELALLFAGFLKYQFGLKVFIDELFWGSADKLIRNLDNKFCKNERGNYDYNMRNFTTTHVHAMLSTAIARTINNSEIVIFLNSEKSIYMIKEEVKKDRTLSPWIYEEILFTSIIGERKWYEHRPQYLKEGKVYFQKALEVSYLLPDEHLIPLVYNDLCDWNTLWQERQSNWHSRYGDVNLEDNERIRHPLNVLYDLKCGYNKKREHN